MFTRATVPPWPVTGDGGSAKGAAKVMAQAQVDIGLELRGELAPIAAAEDRTISNLVRLIIREWLRARAEEVSHA